MLNYVWLTLAEAAAYLRTSEAVVRAKVEKGEIPCVDFNGQTLCNRAQLDEYLFALQAGQGGRTPPTPPLSAGLQVPHGDAAEELPQEEEAAPAMDDFMAKALRLWDDGHAFLVEAGQSGASCKFRGRPRLWVFPNRFQIPPEGKGNELYAEFRKVLATYFPHITSKATVLIESPGFSWKKFVAFISQVKDICHRQDNKSPDAEDPAKSLLYQQCQEWWEEPPLFTIVPGTQGCSAKYRKSPRLWFYPDYVQIPSEGQGNGLFESTREIKERLFPSARTRTRVFFGDPGVDVDRLRTFVDEVKRLCTTEDAAK